VVRFLVEWLGRLDINGGGRARGDGGGGGSAMNCKLCRVPHTPLPPPLRSPLKSNLILWKNKQKSKNALG